VIITYKSNKSEAEQTIKLLTEPERHAMYPLDVADGAEVAAFCTEVITSHTPIDVLVNNAGVYIEHKINEVDFTEWQLAWHDTIHTNLIGAGNLCYFIGRQMIKQGGGKIINVSSRGAFRGEPDHPAYGASKAGLNAMSQSLAVALAPYNITVGVVAPGFVETDMASEYLHSERGEALKKQSPLNRVAQPEEVARVIGVFASGGFEFMTGGIIDLNGASYLRS
jgi:NAD(P)-dependent dehydrogenase (short-subunit alcohol dehydrogenase family)